jgi:glycosyltransferase involved in cell wall biosynthesis
LPSLQGGGAERVATHLLNRCDRSVLDIRLGLLQRTGPYLAEVDGKRVDVAPIGERWLRYEGSNSSFYRPDRLLVGGFLAPANTAMMIRAFKPDVMMSCLKGMSLITYAATGFLGPNRPRWIAREGNNTYAVIDDEVSFGPGRRLVKSVVRNCYRAADCVLANSHEMARGLERDLGLEHDRMRVIHNPVDVPLVRKLSQEATPLAPARPYVVTAGRLEYQKGHDVLLRAFAASPACRDLDLVIIGTGTREEALKAQAGELGIAERVRFLGFVENPWAYIAKARLFVLPSRWEGFPNIVCEALACGAPSLVTNCDFGPSEIVKHGESGWVVPVDDVDALSRSMGMLLGEPELAARLASRGRDRVLQFDLQEMVRAYTALFIEQAMQKRAAASGVGELRFAES